MVGTIRTVLRTVFSRAPEFHWPDGSIPIDLFLTLSRFESLAPVAAAFSIVELVIGKTCV